MWFYNISRNSYSNEKNNCVKYTRCSWNWQLHFELQSHWKRVVNYRVQISVLLLLAFKYRVLPLLDHCASDFRGDYQDSLNHFNDATIIPLKKPNILGLPVHYRRRSLARCHVRYEISPVTSLSADRNNTNADIARVWNKSSIKMKFKFKEENTFGMKYNHLLNDLRSRISDSLR